MMVYIILGRDPSYDGQVAVLGVYSDSIRDREVFDNYMCRGYLDLVLIEEWVD